ncbi:MAG: hypothetical protein ACXWCM_17535 [Acidimicrobiales bacterium]
MAPDASPRATTRVVLDRGLDPFQRLTQDERRRLMIRVLCGLVAYGEPDDVADAAPDPIERLAG